MEKNISFKSQAIHPDTNKHKGYLMEKLTDIETSAVECEVLLKSPSLEFQEWEGLAAEIGDTFAKIADIANELKSGQYNTYREIEDKDYIEEGQIMFSIKLIKSAWHLCYNENLEEEYCGFVNVLKHIVKERED